MQGNWVISCLNNEAEVQVCVYHTTECSSHQRPAGAFTPFPSDGKILAGDGFLVRRIGHRI